MLGFLQNIQKATLTDIRAYTLKLYNLALLFHGCVVTVSDLYVN